jgi:CoA:oxalate CoA-transferase
VSGGNGSPIPEGRRASLLEGVKVLDLTRFLAGPFGSQILADMGAEVLKVEPLTGDSTRATPPYESDGDSAYFLSINRNKHSIALNVSSETGKQVLHKLIGGYDIVLDNMRAGQRKALGLSFEDLVKVNPRIISCSVTGFGSDGPYSDMPAYDIIVEALAGVMSLTGPEGGPSVRAGVPIGDIAGGMYLVIGALGALEYRRATGRGQHVDVSMLDSQISLLSYLAQYYLTGGIVPSHQGRAHLSYPTYNTFHTADDEIVIAAVEPRMWRALCETLGRTDLLEDERLATAKGMLAHRDVIESALAQEFAKWTTADAYAALLAAGIPVAPINRVDAALKDPQVRHREMVVTVKGQNGSDMVTLGTPIKTYDAVGEVFSSAPTLGDYTARALTDAGYSAAEIEHLGEAGVIKIADGKS